MDRPVSHASRPQEEKAAALSAAIILLKTQYPDLKESALRERIEASAPANDSVGVRLLRVNAFCERCAISRPTFFRWVKAEKIKTLRVGGVLRVPEAELSRLVAGGSR